MEEVFRDAHDELNSWLSFIDLICNTMLTQEENTPGNRGRVGFKPKPDKVLLLCGQSDKKDSLQNNHNNEGNASKLHEIFESLLEKGKNSKEGSSSPLWNLFRSKLLDDCERLAFIVALSVDLNRKYEQIYDVLSGDTSGSGRPTIGLIMDMCRLVFSKEECETTKLFDDSTIFRNLLVNKRAYAGSLMGEEISLRRSVVLLLLGKEDDMPYAGGIVSFLVNSDNDERVLDEEILAKFEKIYERIEGGIIHLKAPKGVGKKFLLQRMAREKNLGIIRIHLPMLCLMDVHKMEDVLREVSLKHLLFSDIIYLEFDDISSLPMSGVQDAIRILQQYVFTIVIGGDGNLPDNLEVRGQKLVLVVKSPTMGQQEVLWEEISKRYGISFSEEVELSQLVSKYNLRPGQIEKALLCAKEFYHGKDNDVIVTIGRDILEEQIRNMTGEKLLLLSDRLKTPFGIEDIQLRKEARIQVEQLLNRIKHRSIVNDIYGFSQKLPYGRGVSVVLYGPPGTGKTMLASVIAHELGLDLYRVDTSAIGSKYIGETEKNMEALFEAASGSNGVLFFDEADALFAKRTDVESSNDKHANSEVAFLLQKIEEYDGLSILATNAVQSFDAAFKRRMTYFISVDKPDKDERLEIWKKVFPKETPLANDVNFELYSRVEGMTGSTIKSAAVTAAYFAASKGTDVTNADIIEAIDLEYKKAGNMMGIKESLYSGIL